MTDKPVSNRPLTTYRDFWPHYLQEHAQPRTRMFHFVGTSLATLFAAAAIVTADAWFVPLALVFGYGPAWAAHFFIEHNLPATFTHPLWSLISDYRMRWAWMSGRLDEELAKAGVNQR